MDFTENLTEARATKLLEKLLAKRDTRRLDDLEWCEILFRVRHGFVGGVPVWRQWGHQTWKSFVDEKIGEDQRTIQRKINVWRVFGIHIPKWNRDLLLCHTKMQEIARLHNVPGLLTPKNVNRWLLWAGNAPAEEVASKVTSAIREKQGKKESEVRAFHVLYARFTPSEHNVIQEAESRAREIYGPNRRGALFVEMAKVFLKTADAGSKTKKRA